MNFIFSVSAWLEYFSEDVWLNKLHAEPIWWWSDVNDDWVVLHVISCETDVWWIMIVVMMLSRVYEWMCVRKHVVWGIELQSFYCCMKLFTGKHAWYCLNLDDWLNCMYMSYDQGHFWKPLLSQILPKVLEILYPFWTLALNRMKTLVLKLFTLNWVNDCKYIQGSSLGLWGKFEWQKERHWAQVLKMKNTWEKENHERWAQCKK